MGILRNVLVSGVCGFLCVGLCSCSVPITSQSLADIVADTGDAFSGDWVGTYQADDGAGDLVARVIAHGEGNYRINIYGAFDTADGPIHVMDGVLDGNAYTYTSDGGVYEGKGTLEGDTFKCNYEGPVNGIFEMKHVVRLSPTLGMKAPKGAAVLFNGKNTKKWQHPGKDGAITWELVDGAMEVRKGSIVSKDKFQDFQLHVEFRTPFMAKARGQGRGNSGVYLQGRYEVQVLDSYGLAGLDNECGGIYKVARPRVNMCAPPGQWQTYDMTFKAARFDNQGNKTDNARLTVEHNGVTIHDDIEIPGPTGGARGRNEAPPGGISLQDHGNPVQYRNIWLVEMD